MYINDIHILKYLLIGAIGLIVGQLIHWGNIRLKEYKPVISKDFYREYIKNMVPNYALMAITALLYMSLLYRYGESYIDLIKYMVLIPMLINVFFIDIDAKIIPNRLVLTMLEFGLIMTIIQIVLNTNIGINIFINNILGMLIGGGAFLMLTFIGNVFTKKETMGFGDIKLMAALGLLLGKDSIIATILISFVLAAIISVIILIVYKIKKKEVSEYIAFGPFVSIAAGFVIYYYPFDTFIKLLSNSLK